ncbi:Ig-like domain-containing protein [Luteitalea sp.]|uniref:Ig-like domain-containing protein n=1 Tax=Luteitalea sp. TaxID=2004800 RepID=UPI0025BC2C6B|nr:Ig-like domain-containing protein [Luteitalea sp.]
MPSPARARIFFLLSCVTAVGLAVGPLAGRVLERRFADPRRLQLEAAMEGEERERGEGPGKRFDQPSEALTFYVNSRTGPIVTRGTDVTSGTRTLDASRYLAALQQMRAMPRYSSALGALAPSYDDLPDGVAAAPGAALTTWTNLGPSNQGGRTRALLIDPGNPSVMYAGGVAGGVWTSTDAGATWTPLAQLQMANLAVVSLAFEPGNTSTLYAGTGEGFFNADAIRGAGIFRSTDAGVTWTQLASTNNSNFHYVNSLIVSPRNTQRLWAATRTGLFRSIDGGASWTQLVNGTAVNGCTQVTMQLTGASGFVFGACGNFAQGTVYRADDSDASTFSNVLSSAGMGRSSIAVAPSNPAVVYVMSASTTAGGPGADGLHAVYRSVSNGDSGSFTTRLDAKLAVSTDQQKINRLLLSNPVFGVLLDCSFGAANQFLNQGWYDNVLAVDPLDPNRVWAGGIDLFRSDDGGANWGVASYWWFDKGVDPQYHHADQHGLVFHPGFNGTSNRILFSTSDGGVERVDDARAPVGNTLAAVCGNPVVGSPTWVDRNNGYVTTQFYDGAVYPNGATFFGGLQDNGTQRGTTSGSTWSVLSGGDGGYVAVDTLGDGNASNDVLFLENTGLSIQRSLNGGTTFSNAVSGITGDNGFPFISTFVMNQASRQQLWTGGWFAWRTTNQAGTWTRASALLPGNGSVSAIATHPLDGNRVLYGMSDGYIAVQTAALTATSATVWANTRPSSNFISWIAWDPGNLNIAYATVSAFGVNNLYKSVDGGATWAPSVGSGITALPQIPALSVVVHPTDSLQVFVGTDLGVFTSVDGGASWYLENTGFSNTPVEALEFNDTAPYQLYAFTHGRGAWRVALNTASPTAPIAVADSYSTAFNTPLTVAAPGVLGNDNANGGGAMTAVLDTTTANGTLALNTNGGFTFTPTTGFSGTTSFTYYATNTNGSGNVVTVTLTVNGAAPTTVADAYSTPFNTLLTVAAPGVLGNDIANGGGSTSAVLVTGVAHGTLSLNASGSFTYTPTTGYNGPDSFTYRATNAAGNGNVVTVSLTVNGGAPTTVADTYSTPFNTTLSVAAPGVLANDNNNGGGNLTAVLVTGTSNGTLTLNANGSFSYTPTTGYNGPDSFTYRATNGAGNGNVVTVSIAVGATAPTTVADSYTTPFNTPLSISAPGVLANDNTNGGGAMTASLQSNVAHGTLVLNANGSFTYTPATGYAGADSFTYRAVNGVGNGNAVTVSLMVNAAVPTTVAEAYSTAFNTALTVAAPGVLANDSANGGASLTAVLQSNVAHGTLALNANGSFTYTPATGYSGADSFTYRAVNTVGPGNTVTVSLTVDPAPPVGPQPPSNFRITGISGNTVSMAWTLPTSGPDVIALQLEGGPTPGSVIGALPLGATPAVTVALPTGSFFIRLRSITASGVSSPSNEIVANVNVPVAPSAPSNLLGLVNGSALALAWTPTFGGGAPSNAVLDVTGPVVASLPLGPTETFTYPAVPPGTYTFSVRQTNAAGSSGGSNAVTLTFPGACSGAPQPPRNFAAFNASGVLNVIWDPPASGAAPTAYTIVVGGAYVGALPMTTRSFTIPPPPGTYTFAVTASNACGTSAPTPVQTVTFP